MSATPGFSRMKRGDRIKGRGSSRLEIQRSSVDQPTVAGREHWFSTAVRDDRVVIPRCRPLPAQATSVVDKGEDYAQEISAGTLGMFQATPYLHLVTRTSGRVMSHATGNPDFPSMPKSVREAFTLIEMLIVVTIVGVLAALALPRIRSAQFDADTGMHTVQIVLQQAQRFAILRQTDVIVSFDTAGKRIRVIYDLNNNHQYDPGETVKWSPLDDGNRFVIPPAGVQMTAGASVVGSSLASRDNYPTVYYHRDGALSSELELYLTSHRANLTDERAIHVRQATGRVQLYRYNGSTWIGAGL